MFVVFNCVLHWSCIVIDAAVLFQTQLRFASNLLQELWVQAFNSVANVIWTVGDKAIEALLRLEAAGVVLKAGTLRACFEGLVVPSDQTAVFNSVLEYNGKPTASYLKDTAKQVRKARNWCWLILHPDLPDNLVHPSKSM